MTDKVIMCRMRKNSRCTADIVSAGQCPCVLVPRPLPHSRLPSPYSPLFPRFSASLYPPPPCVGGVLTMNYESFSRCCESRASTQPDVSHFSATIISLLYKTRPKRLVDVNQMLHAGVTDLDGVREEADYRVALRLILE